MDGDDELDGDAPRDRWVDPDDRLWRHPSEVSDVPWPAATLENPLAIPRVGTEPRMWSVAVLAGLIGALLAGGVITAVGGFRRHTTIVRPIETLVAAPITSVSTKAATGSDASDIAENLRPSLVQLVVDGDSGSQSGSGLLFRSDGNIITNNHVVQGATSITAVLANGRQFKARMVGGDPETDIAVVKISPDMPVTVAPMGSAKDLRIGQPAVAMGSPLGMAGSPSVSVGVVGALGRQVTTDAGATLLDMIQTDARVAPTSSGGALVDAAGAVIGIITATGRNDITTEGMGFAIPIDIARDTANQLITTGTVVHVWMGVDGEDVDTTTAAQLSIDGGAVVKRVLGNSPASAAGLLAGDVIVSIDGQPVGSMAAMVVALRSHKPGDRVTVGYLRGGRESMARVKLTTRPPATS
jgi:S1-C subfamily serine protease